MPPFGGLMQIVAYGYDDIYHSEFIDVIPDRIYNNFAVTKDDVDINTFCYVDYFIIKSNTIKFITENNEELKQEIKQKNWLL